MPHRRVILPPSSFCRFSINGDDDPIHNIVHSLQRGDQLLIFYIINYYYFFHTLSLCGRALHTLSLSLSLKIAFFVIELSLHYKANTTPAKPRRRVNQRFLLSLY